MSNLQKLAAETYALIHPFRGASVWPGVDIVEGRLPATGKIGMLDMALNSNALYGQVAPAGQMICPLSSNSAIVVSSATPTYGDLLTWRWMPMRLTQDGRDQLHIQFLVNNTGGGGAGTTSIRVKTTGDSTGVVGTSGSLGNGASEWISIDVDINTSVIETIHVEGLYATSQFTITSITWWQNTLAAATALDTVEAAGFVPQDVHTIGTDSQWGADRPLSVAMCRDIANCNMHIYQDAVRTVAHHAFPMNINLTSNPTYNRYQATSNDYVLLDQFWYDRRDGAESLIVYATGFTENYAAPGDGATYRLSFTPYASDYCSLEFTLDEAPTSGQPGYGTWHAAGESLPIPDAPGPFRIRLEGKDDGGSDDGQLTSLSIFEARPDVA